MTTDAGRKGTAVLRAIGMALGAWALGMVLLTYIAAPTTSVLVLAPQDGKLGAVEAADAYIMGSSGPFLLLRTRDRHSVRDMYEGGAWLVLPAPSPGGCLSLRQPQVEAEAGIGPGGALA